MSLQLKILKKHYLSPPVIQVLLHHLLEAAGKCFIKCVRGKFTLGVMYKFNFLSCIKIVDFVMMPDEKMGFVEEWCVSNIKVSGSRYASVFFTT